ncbi:MAG: ABC transporter ATP-binding protein [Spirochaetales bacterium]|nr:ABC transporter ATP-binding protein [Spirochaetales bacterium]
MVIELKNIYKSYPSGGEEVRVLSDLSLTVKRGDSIAVTGPSGSGKTTLLNCMGLLDTPTSGNVLIDGEETASLKEKELAHIRNRKIGFVFQLHYLLPQCTLWENVLIPSLAFKKDNQKSIAERIKKILSLLDIAELSQAKPYALSGGERQRAAIARALVMNPSLILLDEPTGSLDSENAEKIGVLLKRLNEEEGITLVTVTHSPYLASLMNKRFYLRQGALSETGGDK